MNIITPLSHQHLLPANIHVASGITLAPLLDQFHSQYGRSLVVAGHLYGDVHYVVPAVAIIRRCVFLVLARGVEHIRLVPSDLVQELPEGVCTAADIVTFQQTPDVEVRRPGAKVIKAVASVQETEQADRTIFSSSSSSSSIHKQVHDMGKTTQVRWDSGA